jgi:hypothetical protein
MNLLDTASLVVTPNGYKASKLYSIIPSNGTGDMTFARTGDTATRVNPSGLIEVDAANIPRLDYLGGGCPKLLLEPQRTNAILQSQDISSASWTKTNSPTIVSNAAVAPDGTTTADSIQAADGINYKYISQIISVSANSTYTFSVFIKKETTRTNFGGIFFYFLGGTGKYCYVAVNEVAGTATNLTDSNITPKIKVDDYGTYWRCSVTAIDTGSNTTLIAYYYATISTNGTSSNSGAGSARTIWGMQVEAGAYATSYIPTTTASVTRNADSCSKTSATALIGQTEGVVFFDLNLSDNREHYTYLWARGTTSNVIGFLLSSTYIQAQIFNAGVSQAGIFYNNSSAGRFKIALAYKANDIAYYVNGALVGTDTSATIPATDLIEFYYNSLNNVKINSAALWKTRLQNSELATLTSL